VGYHTPLNTISQGIRPNYSNFSVESDPFEGISEKSNMHLNKFYRVSEHAGQLSNLNI
jgi:hypothetical protein